MSSRSSRRELSNLPRHLLLQQILTSPNLKCYDVPKLAQSLNLRLDNKDYLLLGEHFFPRFSQRLEGRERNEIVDLYRKLCIVTRLSEKKTTTCHEIEAEARRLNVGLTDEDYRSLGVGVFGEELFLAGRENEETNDFEIPGYLSYESRFNDLCLDTLIFFRPVLYHLPFVLGDEEVEYERMPDNFVEEHLDEITKQLDDTLIGGYPPRPRYHGRVYHSNGKIYVVFYGSLEELRHRYGGIPFLQHLEDGTYIFSEDFIPMDEIFIDDQIYNLRLEDLQFVETGLFRT